MWTPKGLNGFTFTALLVMVAPTAFLLGYLCSLLVVFLRSCMPLASPNPRVLHYTFSFTQLHMLPSRRHTSWRPGSSKIWMEVFLIPQFCMHLKWSPCEWCQGLLSAGAVAKFFLSCCSSYQYIFTFTYFYIRGTLLCDFISMWSRQSFIASLYRIYT